MQKLHQPKLIAAYPAAEFYRIHALTYEVQPQASRPHIFQRAPAQPLGIHRHTAIFQHDFESISMFTILGRANATEGCFDGPLRLSAVGLTNDICQRYVDGENHDAAFRLRKSTCL